MSSYMRRAIRELIHGFARRVVANAPLRSLANGLYGRMSRGGQARISALTGRAFWNRRDRVSGVWKTSFMEETIEVPLRADTIGLDWVFAMSIEAHDREILDTYEAILRSKARPAMFLDIGANFGMHSLLFAKVGIPVLSFEPNPACRDYAEPIMTLNGVKPDWQSVALGADEGIVELVFPEDETWLGTTVPDVAEAVGRNHEVRSLTVPRRSLDSFQDQILSPLLIKMDVEGAELLVLSGAKALLSIDKPIIIFECNDKALKDQLRCFFEQAGYRIFALPYLPDGGAKPFSSSEFLSSPGTNYVAVHARA